MLPVRNLERHVEDAVAYMERVSEYYLGLLAHAKVRYTAKVTSAGFKSDSYAILSKCWVAEAETILSIAWNDMFNCNTQLQHTRQAQGTCYLYMFDAGL